MPVVALHAHGPRGQRLPHVTPVLHGSALQLLMKRSQLPGHWGDGGGGGGAEGGGTKGLVVVVVGSGGSIVLRVDVCYDADTTTGM